MGEVILLRLIRKRQARKRTGLAGVISGNLRDRSPPITATIRVRDGLGQWLCHPWRKFEGRKTAMGLRNEAQLFLQLAR
jgi:hypothetical protein